MHALVVTLLLAAPVTSVTSVPSVPSIPSVRPSVARSFELADGGFEPAAEPEDAAITRNRCLGAGAGGAALGVLGAAIGGGIALGISEIIKVSDPANTSASKQFGGIAIPLGAIAGGVAGLALGTIGGWEIGEELARKPSVTR